MTSESCTTVTGGTKIYFPRRYYLTLVAFVGFAVQYAMRVNLSIAILYMTQNSTAQPDVKSPPGGEFVHWDTVTVGTILGSFFYGYILTMFPGGWLACKIGGRRLLGYGIGLCGVLTLFTTVVAHWGPGYLISLRVLEGITQGVCFPSIQAIWGHWAPVHERAKLSGIVYSGFYFGTVLAIPISAVIAEHSHWSAVFYISGVFGILWAIVWLATIYETPMDDKYITKKELALFTGDKSTTSRCKGTVNRKVPWAQMVRSVPVWAIACVNFSSNWGFYTMLTYLPAYMNDILQFKLQKTGFVAAIPYLTMAIFLQISGIMSHTIQKKTGIQLIVLRKWLTSGGSFLQAMFVLLTVVGKDPATATACVCLGLGFGGLVWSGFSTNQLDIADKYAGVVMGFSNTFGTLPGMISPILVGAIVKNKTLEEWRIVFYIVAIVYAIGGIVYVFCGSATKQKWAETSESEKGSSSEELAKLNVK